MNNHMQADKSFTSRPNYDAGLKKPGGDIQLGNGESYSFPSVQQLEEGK
ncbi:hypothetical protein AKJ09_11026 [Labilithrix luteola]|uniref:Uncharacterized protein n=1 Tax=Labilithrix luteola TaxID=1391654 RepID=A0A0K1QF63_9BACT|nr:hypothetical protein AKJ09_11026 [Labilithrix luteola]